MPSTDPGLAVREPPGGARTITGVATSITAFVGRAAAGPTDAPVMLTSYADFERTFGGLDLASPMSYAVRDFYLNGGSLALVVRVLHEDATASTIVLDGGAGPSAGIVLVASSRGAWGNRLSAAVDHDTDRALPAASPPATDDQRFDLVVRFRPQAGPDDVVDETFASVSTAPGDARFLPRVLERESAYVRVLGPMPTTRPPSNVTWTGTLRSVAWVDADIGSGSDGTDIDDDDVIGREDAKTGLHALNDADLFNLLCIPPRSRDAAGPTSRYTATSANVYRAALALCAGRRAMLVVDPDPAWAARSSDAADLAIDGCSGLGLDSAPARNAALYFPCVLQVDPLRDGRVDTFVPSGIVSGVIARTDAQHGVWKAPAGPAASLDGVQGLQVQLTDLECGRLGPHGINGLRAMGAGGPIVWGARTLGDADGSTDPYAYLPVRRLALFLEESLDRGLRWVAFEPDDEALRARVRLEVDAFMQGLFRQGAFRGATAREAYFVECDDRTTTQHDVDLGILNVVVGFAPLKPAEFVVLRIQTTAGRIAP